MRRFLSLAVCAFFVSTAGGQDTTVKPLQFASGAILSFRLQTRLRPVAGDPLNDVPSGTILQVKMLDSLDASANADGIPFRASVISPLVVAGRVVVHADAEVHGLQVLLRNRNHPEGFRYELLITNLVDHGESYTITASFDPATPDGVAAPLSPSASSPAADGPVLSAKSSEGTAN